MVAAAASLAWLQTMAKSLVRATEAVADITRSILNRQDQVKAHPLYPKIDEAWSIIQEVYDIRPSDLNSLRLMALFFSTNLEEKSDD